MLTASEESTLP